MFKIESVEISEFWHRFDASCNFNPNVNIIIGRNGTGKTTFMNILYAILAVDVEAMGAADFDSATIVLNDGKKRRTIHATKVEHSHLPFLIVEYTISRKKHEVRIIPSGEGRVPVNFKRRSIEESAIVREELSKLVCLSSLSVYRLRSSDDYEVRDRSGRRLVAPVDYRLSELMQRLTHYQLELSQEAREVSAKLQKDVLASVLYGKEDADSQGWKLDFDKNAEKKNLISAYGQLQAMDSEVRRKINFHVDAIDKSIDWIKKAETEQLSESDEPLGIDIRSLEALRKTRKIIEMSLEAKEATNEIYAPIELFLNILRSFVSEKEFEFYAGDLVVKTRDGQIPLKSLSSGEKQLLILLTEALLQKEQPHIFLADEPELSLHIEWQRKIIPAVRELNPNAQIIAATHSPEIAAKFRDSIFDMEELVND